MLHATETGDAQCELDGQTLHLPYWVDIQFTMDNKFEVGDVLVQHSKYFPLQSQLFKTAEIIDGVGIIRSTLMLL